MIVFDGHNGQKSHASLDFGPAFDPFPAGALIGIAGFQGRAHPRTAPVAPVGDRLKAELSSPRLAILICGADERDAHSQLQAGASPVL